MQFAEHERGRGCTQAKLLDLQLSDRELAFAETESIPSLQQQDSIGNCYKWSHNWPSMFIMVWSVSRLGPLFHAGSQSVHQTSDCMGVQGRAVYWRP